VHAHEFSITMLLLLGAVHGINPGMGWLFAVSLGLQEERRDAIWKALAPLALGHALAIGVVVAAVAWLGVVVPLHILKWIVAAMLLSFGILHLLRHWHPRSGGMRVGFRDLTVWSFLMATAHGAGLMALPFTMELTASRATATGHLHGLEATHSAHVGQLALASVPGADSTALIATLVHSIGYLTVAGLLAFIVYEKVGLKLLRTAWVNLNVVWAGTLIVTALVTVLL
jgi:hypothetical protein